MSHIPPASETARRRANAFLAVAADFHLGQLETEQRHPATAELAQLAKNDLPRALDILKNIETDMLGRMVAYHERLRPLAAEIEDTLKNGNRVFFYGCGATGRLSLSIEHIWRALHGADAEKTNAVQGFMSGGDVALVHSIENFEDHPEYGARQVREAGFGARDLLIACTEGGETPSVIGATEEAARLSARAPFYLYCNPTDVLMRTVERARRVLSDARIRSICLSVGPMYLSGSTRLQASSALMLAAGGGLMEGAQDVRPLQEFLERCDIGFLQSFIEEESRAYAQGDYLLYETARYAMTVLTDTTERAPTFSLRGFENGNDLAPAPSLSFLRLPAAQDAMAAWRAILLREPVALEWNELNGAASHARLAGFDFSAHALCAREKITAPHHLHRFSIARAGDDMTFALGALTHSIRVAPLHPLHEHVFLKILLNMHSTLVMGRLGRYESNVMTWVKPSNNKLIDRAIRYVRFLLEQDGKPPPSYEETCLALFAQMETMQADQSIVMLTKRALEG